MIIEEIVGSGLNGGGVVAKKPHRVTSRRPRLDSQALVDGSDPPPPSTTLSTDGTSRSEQRIRREENSGSSPAISNWKNPVGVLSILKSLKELFLFPESWYSSSH